MTQSRCETGMRSHEAAIAADALVNRCGQLLLKTDRGDGGNTEWQSLVIADAKQLSQLKHRIGHVGLQGGHRNAGCL